MAVAQFFGLFPIVGVFSRSIKSVAFKWTSFRVVHSLLWLGSVLLFMALELRSLSRADNLNAKSSSWVELFTFLSISNIFESTDGLTFYVAGFFGGIFFFRLAIEWSDILRAFEKVETIFQGESYPHNSGWNMKKRIRLTSFILLFFALIEHTMATASFLFDRFTQVQLCQWEIGSYFYYLATTHLGQIYAELPVNVLTVVWAEYMNISLTFAWNFIDVFIIVMSIGVASKFDRINKRLEYFRERVRKLLVESSSTVFMFLRSSFFRLSAIAFGRRFAATTTRSASFRSSSMKGLATSYAWLVSMTCTLCAFSYWMSQRELKFEQSFQVDDTFPSRKLPFLINSVYYWYSMIFLIARTSAMFFIASSINDEAKKPLKILRSIPNEGWFPSTQRFSKQVQNDCIALSGKKFFYITRGIIISIAGTVVTYELVLLQFDADKIESAMFNPCPKPQHMWTS